MFYLIIDNLVYNFTEKTKGDIRQWPKRKIGRKIPEISIKKLMTIFIADISLLTGFHKVTRFLMIH